MALYTGLRHFTYAGLRVEPGQVFPRLAVRINNILEQRGYVELCLTKEHELAECPRCPAKFIDHSYMQRHVENNRHADGRVVFSEEGIRTREQEEEIDALMNSIPKEKPGRMEATPDGSLTDAPRRKKVRA